MKYFTNEKVAAVAANVKIAKAAGILNLIQTFEYVICYQMKRAQTLLNIEYIIGGIGSVFRRNFLEQIDYYDVNTVTEDIDLTMKILRGGNNNVLAIYGSDVIAFTQSAQTIGDLISQRHRWKWGRYQTFLKNKSMFFSPDEKFTKGLSWFYLPFAIFSDLAFLFEPVIVTFMLSIIIIYKDIPTFLSTVTVMSFYIGMNIISEETISAKGKLQLIVLTPVVYFLFYILSFVEYLALVKSLVNIYNLQNSLQNNKNSWEPAKRQEFTRTYS